MNSRKDANDLLSALVRRSWESHPCPAADVPAIELRAKALAPGKSGGSERIAISSLRFAIVCVIILAALAVIANPNSARSVSAAVVRVWSETFSAHALSNGTMTETLDPTTTLAIIRNEMGARFVEPAGLPKDSRIVSVSHAAEPAHPAAMLLYRDARGAMFSIWERTTFKKSKHPGCFAIGGTPARLAHLSRAQRSKLADLPKGLRLLPCSAGVIQGVQVQVTAVSDSFTKSQGEAILRAMRQARKFPLTKKKGWK